MRSATLAPPFEHANLRIPAAGVTLTGDLIIPANARGLVIFAHGSGSSRRSPRNRRVAEWLHHAGLGTLLFDLLTQSEEAVDTYTAEHRFDIELLGARLAAVTDWIAVHPTRANSTSAISARAPAPRRRYWPRRCVPTSCARWCAVAGGPTWLGPRWVLLLHPSCSSSGAGTPRWRSSTSSPAMNWSIHRRRCCRWCREPPISSRSAAPSSS